MTHLGIVVAESLALVRDGLSGLLANWPHGPVRSTGTMAGLIPLLDADPDAVLLFDMELLGAEGAAGLQAVRARYPQLRIVALAPHQTRDGVLQCLAAGAHGFVAKSETFAELACAIERVRGGGVHVPGTFAHQSAQQSMQPAPTQPAGEASVSGTMSVLTGRQQDVLRLLAEGRSTKDIARTLDLAVSTIKVHLAAVYRTFGARNRVEALCRAGCLPRLATHVLS